MKLRIPMALSVVAVTTSSIVLVESCGGGQSPPTADADTCLVHCVPEGSDDTNCPFPTCATGSNMDECGVGCIPEPIV